MSTESTPAGQQHVLPGVEPLTLGQQRAAYWNAQPHGTRPQQRRKAQKPCSHGLFDMAARDQIDMF